MKSFSARLRAAIDRNKFVRFFFRFAFSQCLPILCSSTRRSIYTQVYCTNLLRGKDDCHSFGCVHTEQKNVKCKYICAASFYSECVMARCEYQRCVFVSLLFYLRWTILSRYKGLPNSIRLFPHLIAGWSSWIQIMRAFTTLLSSLIVDIHLWRIQNRVWSPRSLGLHFRIHYRVATRCSCVVCRH